MSDILVQKPQAGQVLTFTPQPKDRIILDFDTNDALFNRVEDSLEMSFEDGSHIKMEGFYVSYTVGNMPTFIIDDEVVDTENFFANLGETLFPAAGNLNSPQGSGVGIGLEEGLLHGGLKSLGGIEGDNPQGAQGPEGPTLPENAGAGTDDGDGAGNVVVPDTTATLAPVVTIQSGSNEYISKAEYDVAGGVDVSIGIPADALVGDTLNITVSINGVLTTQEVVIDKDMLDAGEYTFNIAGAADGSLEVSATITDAAGNESESGADTAIIDTTASVTVSIDNVTADNILSAAEITGNVNVTGKVTGDFVSGTVELTINGTSYKDVPLTKNADGTYSYSVSVLGSDLAADPDFTVTANVQDAVGNTATGSADKAVVLDTTALAPVVTIQSGSDEYINKAEYDAAGGVDVAIGLPADVLVGDRLNITITNNGVPTTQEVIIDQDMLDAGEYTFNIQGAADGSLDVSATITDAVGNESAEGVDTAIIDTIFEDGSANLTDVTLDSVEGDGIVDENELLDGIEVTGTVTGVFAVGDTVTLEVRDASGNPVLDSSGKVYTVTTTVGVGGKFSATLDSQYYDDGKYTVSATVDATDDAGNLNKVSDTEDLSVSSTTMQVSVDDVDGVRYYNLNVTGKINVDFNGSPDDFTFTVKIGGKDYNLDASTGGTIKLPSTGLPGNSISEIIITPVAGSDGEYTFTYIPYGTASSDAVVDFDIILTQKETGHTEHSDVHVNTVHRDIETINIGNYTLYSTGVTIDGEYSGPNLRPYNYGQLQTYINQRSNNDFDIEGTGIGQGYRTTTLSTHNGDDDIVLNSTGNGVYSYNNHRYHPDSTTVNMGNGADEFTINVTSNGTGTGIMNTSTGSRARSYATVNMGNGDDAVTINVLNSKGDGRGMMTHGEAGHTNVNMNSGDDSVVINVKGNQNGMGIASNGGSSSVNMHDGNDTLSIDVSENRGNGYGMYATRQGHGSSKTANANMGTGDDVLTINVQNNNGTGFGMYSQRPHGPAPANNIRLEDGNDVLAMHVEGNKGGDYAMHTTLSSNTIDGGKGDDDMSLIGRIYSNNGTNLINGGDDYDTLGLTNTVDNNHMVFKGDADNLDMHYGSGAKQADINNVEEIRFGHAYDTDKDAWDIVDDSTDDYNIDFSQVTAAADGSGLTIMAANGDDTIKGTQGDDVIFGGGGNDILHGGSGDDLIIDDVFSDVDGGEGMDVLLVGAASLLDDVKSKLENGVIDNTEVVIVGDNVTGNSTEEVFNNLGIETNASGYIELDASWGAGKTSGNFTEFTNHDDSVTVLVETIKLETGA